MKIGAYLNEVYSEMMHKVTWPTWKELQSSAVVVMVASVIIALIVWVMDISFEGVMDQLYALIFPSVG